MHLDLADEAGFEASCAQASTCSRPVLVTVSELQVSKAGSEASCEQARGRVAPRAEEG